MSKKLYDIGILGAGQLARMLAEAAQKKSRQVCVWSASSQDPATLLGIKGFESLEALLQSASHILFENEFVDVAELRRLQAGNEFIPSLDCIELFQNKLRQKQILQDLNIPTAGIKILPPDEDLSLVLENMRAPRLVFKWAMFGYDGRGNFVSDFPHVSRELRNFIRLAKAEIYAEDWIPFEKEFALVGCRFGNEISFLPLVESRQEHGVCKWVQGPASALGSTSEIEEEAKRSFRTLTEAVDMQGCMAMEFFWSSELGLLVNELAPRVHNSAHFSLVGSSISQFDMQIQRALGEKFPGTPKSAAKYFGMLNLLSPLEEGRMEVPAGESEVLAGRATCYWYGKSELRKRRKMGHIHFIADSLEELKETEAKLDTWEKEFWQHAKQS